MSGYGSLYGTVVTVAHALEGTFSTVVVADVPAVVRTRLQEALAESAFLCLEAVDLNEVYYFNLEHVAYIQIEPTVLADPDARD